MIVERDSKGLISESPGCVKRMLTFSLFYVSGCECASIVTKCTVVFSVGLTGRGLRLAAEHRIEPRFNSGLSQ